MEMAGGHRHRGGRGRNQAGGGQHVGGDPDLLQPATDRTGPPVHRVRAIARRTWIPPERSTSGYHLAVVENGSQRRGPFPFFPRRAALSPATPGVAAPRCLRAFPAARVPRPPRS